MWNQVIDVFTEGDTDEAERDECLSSDSSDKLIKKKTSHLIMGLSATSDVDVGYIASILDTLK